MPKTTIPRSRKCDPIAERKRTEVVLRDSEKRVVSSIQASLQEGFYVLNRDWVFTFASTQFTSRIGKKPEDLVGRNIWEMFPKYLGTIYEENLRAVMERREMRRFEVKGHYTDAWYGMTVFPSAEGITCLGMDISERKRTEEVLREREQLLQTVIDGSTSPIFLKDLDGKFITINAALERILGISREEIKGKTDYDIASMEAADYWRTHDKQVMATRKAIQIEEVADLQDGHHIFLANKFPLVDAAGQIYGVGAISHDITDRKQAEEKLREQAALLKAAEATQEERQRLFRVLETLPAMVCLLTPDYHVTFANRSFRERFGESEGRHCYEFCFGRSLPCEFCESYNVLKTGEPHHWVVKGPDGSVIDTYDFPLTDVDGSPLILEMDIDVTEQRKAEAALREVGAYNRTLIEASPDPLVTIGPDGRITDVNAATEHATGHSRQELVGTDFSEYFSEPEKAKAGYQQVFREGAVHNYPLEICHRDGHMMPVLYNATVYRSAEGKVVGVFAAARDVTDLKKAEQELRRAHEDLAIRASQLRALASRLTLSEQRERTRLARILHDHLQQLLVAVKFRAAVLGRGGDELLRKATKEIEDLIDESIAASRSLTAELSPPILQEAGLKAGLQWLARRMTDKQGLFVELGIEEDEDFPQDIKVLLFESVRELLLNVVKHAETRSATVNVRRIGNHLQVIVSDQGVGFDPTAIPPAGEGGTGFGLLNMRERVEFVGGTLEIQSIPGQGSRFVLSVPITARTANEPKLREKPMLPEGPLMETTCPAPGRKIRVMLADDHILVRQGISNLLADQPDLDVIGEVADGQEAVDMATRLLPDVILMDVSMPKLNGIEATRAIHNEYPEMCIIGLSMFEDSERAQAMRDAGAVSYLTKSGPVDVLMNAIRTSVQSSAETPSAKS